MGEGVWGGGGVGGGEAEMAHGSVAPGGGAGPSTRPRQQLLQPGAQENDVWQSFVSVRVARGQISSCVMTTGKVSIQVIKVLAMNLLAGSTGRPIA